MTDLTDAQRVERGQRAKRAIDEFFAPAMARIKSTFGERLKEICVQEPWENQKVVAAAHVIRIVEILEGDLLTLIHDGEHAANNMIKAERYEQLTPAQRRLVAIGPRG